MRWFAVPVVAVLLGACGSDGDSSAATPASVSAPESSASASASTAMTDTTAVEETTAATVDTASTDASVPVTMADVASDVTSTGGEQPTLSWPAAEGATLYSLVVTDADGVAFWGWQGTDLSVTVGDGAPDPIVSPDMTWSVVALDADGAALWDSGPVPV